MTDFPNNSKPNETFNQEQFAQYSFFPNKIYDEENQNLTIFSSGEERFFFNKSDLLLNNKRKKETNKKGKKTHNKYTYDNLKRSCKHLVIENIMKFINRKIYIKYNGNIGAGIVKKELVKLEQFQKKNSKAEFNKIFLKKTLKEILSQNITKRIKFLSKDHNKKLIEKLLEEKREDFESLFNLTFIECVDHFIGKKFIEELDGLKLFSELKDEIITKHEDGENYYQNLEIFLKEFEQRINNAKPRNTKSKENQKDE